jgi:toxin-antitoxin system PIN domain toxin
MILVDANLLVYACTSSSSKHREASAWLDRQLNDNAIVALPWQSLLAFARLVTNPRVFERPLSIQAAWTQIETWLDCPIVRIPVPGERHRDILADLMKKAVDRPNLIPDAHLAALAIENGFLLCSSDRDFARFPNLRWQDPLHPTG